MARNLNFLCEFFFLSHSNFFPHWLVLFSRLAQISLTIGTSITANHITIHLFLLNNKKKLAICNCSNKNVSISASMFYIFYSSIVFLEKVGPFAWQRYGLDFSRTSARVITGVTQNKIQLIKADLNQMRVELNTSVPKRRFNFTKKQIPTSFISSSSLSTFGESKLRNTLHQFIFIPHLLSPSHERYPTFPTDDYLHIAFQEPIL